VKTKRIAILGSTGSIGRQTLDVIAELPELRACALAAGANAELLAEQARRFRPEMVALSDGQAAAGLAERLPEGTALLTGPDAMTELVRRAKPDVVLTGVVGAAGLAPTMAAIECGAELAVANKETLVMAGAVVMPAARKAGVPVLPVDSEHSAIFQCLSSGRRDEVRRVVITSSGGALRDWDDDRSAAATVDDALRHPTWSMGRKITIDSATLMNKALEIVEESAYSAAEMAAYEGYWDAVRREATFVGELDDARAELAEERKKLDAAKAERDAAKAELEKLRQDKLNTARKMKDKGFAVADIADLTGLTADEIARLSPPLGLESAPRSLS